MIPRIPWTVTSLGKPTHIYATDGIQGISFNTDTYGIHMFIRQEIKYCPKNWTVA